MCIHNGYSLDFAAFISLILKLNYVSSNLYINADCVAPRQCQSTKLSITTNSFSMSQVLCKTRITHISTLLKSPVK